MRTLFRIIDGVVLGLLCSMFMIFPHTPFIILSIPMVSILTLINIFPSPYNLRIKNTRYRICSEGADILTSFLIGTVIAVIVDIIALFIYLPDDWFVCIRGISATVLILCITFWNGIIRVYCTSTQLGIKWRIIGALCGMIPILNLWALANIIIITTREVEFENSKSILNASRADEKLCSTKYPILMVHGVFFRDFKNLNYWGRIPNELINNGGKIYYGNHQSALSIKDSGEELANRIKSIVEETGCEKLNIIAHSKGGLDCRYAITHCGMDKYVASLTTINTPHRGCIFVDNLLTKISVNVQNKIANAYNTSLKKLGDKNPDFMSAVRDLTVEKCTEFNNTTPNADGVYYQSIGSRLNKAVNGKFPLNLSYNLVRRYSGKNDGLVSEDSFPWGDCYQLLTVKGKRGISHGDMIDLNRENIKYFDDREFYVTLVNKLKNMGF